MPELTRHRSVIYVGRCDVGNARGNTWIQGAEIQCYVQMASVAYQTVRSVRVLG